MVSDNGPFAGDKKHRVLLIRSPHVSCRRPLSLGLASSLMRGTHVRLLGSSPPSSDTEWVEPHGGPGCCHLRWTGGRGREGC